VEREYVNGEGFLYLGRSYRLKFVTDQDAPLILKDGYFCLRVDQKKDGSAAFRAFYRAKGLTRIGDRVGYYQDKMGVVPKSVRVVDLKNRWASCSADGHLNFHWKCMMAPTTILDYIAVHELAHLRYPNHTAAFWNEVDKVLPDYRERKEWLRANGAGMDL
jgi:predicted metal-dependent hydrolase